MSLGRREVADDVFGGLATDSDMDSFDNFGMAPRSRRKKSKKRSRVSSSRKRQHRPKSRRRKHKSSARSGKKRRGMSKEFLRNLRKKHGLGEFKK